MMEGTPQILRQRPIVICLALATALMIGGVFMMMHFEITVAPKTEVTATDVFGYLPRTSQLLEHGWDQKALQIFLGQYRNSMDARRRLKVDFPIGSLSAWVGPGHDAWWGRVSKGEWEIDTFREFHYNIDGSTTFIDFGTWIGPTVLFGAQIAKRSFAIEADPCAYAQMLFNAKLNADSHWYKRLLVQPGCVHIENESIQQMSTTGVGNSGSSMGKAAGSDSGVGLITWKVKCYTMPHLFKVWDINSEKEHVFIKIDVESYECNLIPSWYAWLKPLSTKPTLYLSMHGQITKCTEQQYEDIARVANLYKYKNSKLLSKDGRTIVGQIGEFILSDVMPPL